MGENNFVTFVITILTVIIALIVPVPIPDEYRLGVIAGVLFLFISISLSNFNKKLEEQEKEQKKLEERLKIYERLAVMDSNIKELQRKVFPKNEKRK